MDLEGSYTFEAPRDLVWQSLLDPAVLAKTLPGCEKLDKIGDNEYEGTIKIKVGPVQGKFKGVVSLSNLNEPDSYSLSVDGKGAPGFMKGSGDVRLEAQGESTVMHYAGTAQVGGRIASVGQRLLDSSAKALTRQSLDSIHQQIKARLQTSTTGETETQAATTNGTAPAPAPSAEINMPSQTEFAMGVAKNMLDDLVPAEERPKLIVSGVALLFLLLIVRWWVRSIARQAAIEILLRRR